jgi:hypothetical protein
MNVRLPPELVPYSPTAQTSVLERAPTPFKARFVASGGLGLGTRIHRVPSQRRISARDSPEASQ